MNTDRITRSPAASVLLLLLLAAALAALLGHPPGGLSQNEPDLNLDGRVPVYVWPQKLTARVVDEQGAPVEGAEVLIGMSDAVRFRDAYNTGIGKSDARGRFTWEAPGDGHASIIVRKEGHYQSRTRYTWRVDVFQNYDGSPDFEIPEDFRAEPWDPEVEVVLVEIGERVPLVERHRGFYLQGLNQVHEYDLLEGDFMPPHGQGTHADLLFRTHVELIEELVWYTLLEIEFLGVGNGMIPVSEAPYPESEFKYLREAPAEGYDLKLIQRAAGAFARTEPAGRHESDLMSNLSQHVQRPPRLPLELPYMWVFRIRNELAAEGKGPIYGVLDGGLLFTCNPGSGHDRAALNLRLAFNPDPGNRILERAVPEPPTFPPGVPPPVVPPPSPEDFPHVTEDDVGDGDVDEL